MCKHVQNNKSLFLLPANFAKPAKDFPFTKESLRVKEAGAINKSVAPQVSSGPLREGVSWRWMIS